MPRGCESEPGCFVPAFPSLQQPRDAEFVGYLTSGARVVWGVKRRFFRGQGCSVFEGLGRAGMTPGTKVGGAAADLLRLQKAVFLRWWCA